MRVHSSFLLLFIAIASTQALLWKDCGSKLAKVKDVSVTGCKNSKICDLPRGTNLTFTVDFMTNAGAEDATSVVHGIVGGVPLPFPIDQPDACKDKHAGLNCPIKSKKAYAFHPQIYVHSSYPKLKVVVKWELKNPSGQDIFCVMVPAQITDKKANAINRTKPRSNRTPKLLQLL